MVARKAEKRIARRIKSRASKGCEKRRAVWKSGRGAERLRSQDPKLKKEEVIENWEGSGSMRPMWLSGRDQVVFSVFLCWILRSFFFVCWR